MGSAARLVRGEQQKQIVKLIEGMAGRRSVRTSAIFSFRCWAVRDML